MLYSYTYIPVDITIDIRKCIYIDEIRYEGATVVHAFTPEVILPPPIVRQTDVLGT